MSTNRPAPQLTQQQIKDFFLCNAQSHESLPREIERIIMRDALLEHVAFARLTEAEEIIAFDPSYLLLEHAGNVITPAGLHLINVTPYECALSGGDVGMRKMIFKYFEQLKDGAKEEAAQYGKYCLHIENIGKETPYLLHWMIDVLKKSNHDDVIVELNRHTEPERYKDHHSDLRDALETFRKDWTPGDMKEPGMQFNYASLQHAYDIYNQEFRHLTHVDQNGKYSNGKRQLFYWQVIGFEQRHLAGRDRQIYAGGFYDYANDEEKAPRSFNLASNKGESFPILRDSDSNDGLGFDFAIGLFGNYETDRRLATICDQIALRFKNLCQSKVTNLRICYAATADTKNAACHSLKCS